MKQTLRTRLADAEARACDKRATEAESQAARLEVEALSRVLRRGGK